MAKGSHNSSVARPKPKAATVFEQDSDGLDTRSLQLDSGSELGSDMGESADEEEEEPPAALPLEPAALLTTVAIM